jgi:transcriptional regulator with XRE-family HTH domain
LRRGWRQADLADAARVSQSTISNIELGRLDGTSFDTLRRVVKALDARLDIAVRWRGGELDRLLSSRHAGLATAVATYLQRLGWDVAPEVSFAIYGERGSIDILAWHQPTSSLLVVEVKTELIDIHDTLTVLDRKIRLAPAIARNRGWRTSVAAAWLVIAEGSTNRHRVRQFQSLLRAALPAHGNSMAAWLREPSGRIAALSFFSNTAVSGGKQQAVGRKRVRVRRTASAERGRLPTAS